jgi:hypothetical protein
MDSEDDLVAAIEKNELSPHDFTAVGPFTMTDKGLMKNGSGKGALPVKISARFEIIGRCRNPNSKDWGKTLRFCDADGQQSERPGSAFRPF